MEEELLALFVFWRDLDDQRASEMIDFHLKDLASLNFRDRLFH